MEDTQIVSSISSSWQFGLLMLATLINVGVGSFAAMLPDNDGKRRFTYTEFIGIAQKLFILWGAGGLSMAVGMSSNNLGAQAFEYGGPLVVALKFVQDTVKTALASFGVDTRTISNPVLRLLLS